MKKLMLLAAVLVACGPSEQATTDTGQTAAAAAAPMALTAADITGTWTGTIMPEVGDSVLGRFTVVSTGMESKGVLEGTKDTVTYTHTLDADSFIAVSAPYRNSMAPGRPQVTDRVVGRKLGDKLVGTTVVSLVSKPDSVVMRARWEATKAP